MSLEVRHHRRKDASRVRRANLPQDRLEQLLLPTLAPEIPLGVVAEPGEDQRLVAIDRVRAGRNGHALVLELGRGGDRDPADGVDHAGHTVEVDQGELVDLDTEQLLDHKRLVLDTPDRERMIHLRHAVAREQCAGVARN